jgi:PAS domain S-box-containing protein
MDGKFMTREDLVRQMRRSELEVKTRQELIEEVLAIEERLARAQKGETQPDPVTDALREIEDRYKLITENVRLAIFRETISPGEMLLEANSSAAAMFGYDSKEEFIAASPLDLYRNEKDRLAIHERVVAEGYAIRDKVTLKKQDGTGFSASIRSVAVPNGDGKLRHCIGIVEDLTERDQAEEVRMLFGTLQGAAHALTATIEMMDCGTAREQQRIARIAIAIGKKLGLNDDEITGIGLAAVLHDIGKIYIPQEILKSNDELSDRQFSMVKDHSEVGFNILKTVESKTPGFPWPIPEIVLQHHERLDGSGYPQGLIGKEILPGARILAVADVVAAMTTDRPYRPALGFDKALEEITTNRSKLYDPDVVDACVEVLKEGRVKPD